MKRGFIVVYLFLPAMLRAAEQGTTGFSDSIFLWTLGFLFLGAIAGTVFKRFSRDRCLRDFEGFNTTLEEKDGRIIYGKLKVYPTALEFIYTFPHKDRDGHIETSTIYYEDQFDGILALYRFHDQLNEENQKRRLEELRGTDSPSLFRRFSRSVRNLLNSFQDAFVRALDLVIGRLRTTRDDMTALKAGEGNVKQIGTNLIGVMANAFDPVLEEYIGKRVVIEMMRDEKWDEFPGILKEYTAKFIEVLNVPLARITRIVPGGDAVGGVRSRFESEAGTLVVENQSVSHVRIIGIENFPGDFSVIELEPSSHVEINWKEQSIPEGILVEDRQICDIIFPRTHSVMRHGGEQKQVSWQELAGLTRIRWPWISSRPLKFFLNRSQRGDEG